MQSSLMALDMARALVISATSWAVAMAVAAVASVMARDKALVMAVAMVASDKARVSEADTAKEATLVSAETSISQISKNSVEAARVVASVAAVATVASFMFIKTQDHSKTELSGGKPKKSSIRSITT